MAVTGGGGGGRSAPGAGLPAGRGGGVMPDGVSVPGGGVVEAAFPRAAAGGYISWVGGAFAGGGRGTAKGADGGGAEAGGALSTGGVNGGAFSTIVS